MKRHLIFGLVVLFMTVGGFAQTTQTIGRVAQSGTNFVVFSPAGSRVSSSRIGRNYSHTLVGWGTDFFVVQNLNAIYTHDARGRRIARWSIGNPNVKEHIISRIIVSDDAVTVFIIGRGVVPIVFDRNLNEIQ